MADAYRFLGLTVLGLMSFASCNGSTENNGSGKGHGGSEPEPDAAPLFAAVSIPRFEITLSDNDVVSLNDSPKEYIKGDVTVELDGQLIDLPDTGIRLKGKYGSFRSLDEKAAFLLNFDKYVGGQHLLGLEKLALNNMVQDPSMIHERLGYALFRGNNVPAPRSAYANVFVNGELYGLYTTIEVADNSSFLNTWFGSDKGSLYEGNYGSDLQDGLIETYDQDNGPDVGFADLQKLTNVLDNATNPATFMADVSTAIDMDSYLHFAATEIFLGHWDGYAWTKNNYFIYRRPDNGRWVFLPWGLDQTFSEYLYPFGGEARLQVLCNASLPCRQALAKAFEDVLVKAAELDLINEATVIKNLIWNDAVADPRKEYDSVVINASIDQVIDFLQNRPPDIQSGLACVDPMGIDSDGDGYSGCSVDCDDENAAINPGAAEICNFADDNCDGIWDNDPGCPQCMVQPLPTGGSLAFCFQQLSYSLAESDCMAQGGHLASIHDSVTHNNIVSQAFAIAETEWWIGLNDAVVEGQYNWTDGTPSDFLAWAPGEPNNADNEDCVHLASWVGGQWNDLPCDIPLNYVCLLP